MTRYIVQANGQHGPFEGLNKVAEELVDQWLTRPGGNPTVEARQDGAKRPLTPNEHEAVTRRLVQLAMEHREQQPFQMFDVGAFA